MLTKLDIKQPPGTMVTSEKEALVASKDLGYPVMVRPSFVLGGRAMEIVYRHGSYHPLHTIHSPLPTLVILLHSSAQH